MLTPRSGTHRATSPPFPPAPVYVQKVRAPFPSEALLAHAYGLGLQDTQITLVRRCCRHNRVGSGDLGRVAERMTVVRPVQEGAFLLFTVSYCSSDTCTRYKYMDLEFSLTAR
jgi:hypothetical protein